MYITPVGFVLFPFAIWLLWQAMKAEGFKLYHGALKDDVVRLRRRRDFFSEDDDVLDNLLLDAKKKIYRAGFLILASMIVFFCAVFFAIKTPNSSYHSPAWVVALLVGAYYGIAIVGQFIVPLLDLKQLQSDEVSLLKLDD